MKSTKYKKNTTLSEQCPTYNRNTIEPVGRSMSLTYLHMTVHFPGLVHVLQ